MVTIEVITGPMFSGKSEELIRQLKRATYAKQKILAIKPGIDTRNETPDIVTRVMKAAENLFEPSDKFPASPIHAQEELKNLMSDEQPDILAADEAQFFEEWFYEFIENLKLNRKDLCLKIVIAGLDMDAWGEPFGPMPKLLAIADIVRKETAVCFKCKNPNATATMTQKLSHSNGSHIEIGDAELYEARCLNCWTPPEENPA